MHAHHDSRRTHGLSTFTAALTSASLLLAAPAWAQEECGDAGVVVPPDVGGLRDFFPGSGDRGVPLDGFVRLRYVLRVPRPVIAALREVGGGSVSSRLVVLDDEVHILPDAPLRASTEYEVRASDASAGAGGTAYRFFTGSGRTTGLAPNFSGLSSVTSARSGASDRCGDPNAVQITASWRRAVSNGWPDVDIEYLVFQTAGPNVREPLLRTRQRGGVGALSCAGLGDEQCTTFRLSSENAAGRVCFAALALDPSGRALEMSSERCIDPQVGNYFYGCAVAAPGSRRARARPGAAGLGVLAALSAVARRRRLRR